MLLRPTRPLPRRFNRRVNKSTSSFVKRRHQRHKQYARERWSRLVRRFQHTSFQGISFLRQWLWVTLAGGLLLAFAVLLFSPLVHVREIRVRRTDARLDSEAIQQALRPVFGKHLFFLSSREVQTLVMQAIPDVEDVTVEKRYPSELFLSVLLHPIVSQLQIAAPDAGSAAPSPSAGSGSQQKGVQPKATAHDYLTDNALYVSVPFVSTGSQLPVIKVVDWAVRPIPGSALFSADFFQRMRDAEIAMHDQLGLKVTGRTVYLRAREFHLATPRFSLWFDSKSPLEEEIARYRSFVAAVGLGDVKSYIDLRIKGRIVYK